MKPKDPFVTRCAWHESGLRIGGSVKANSYKPGTIIKIGSHDFLQGNQLIHVPAKKAWWCSFSAMRLLSSVIPAKPVPLKSGSRNSGFKKSRNLDTGFHRYDKKGRYGTRVPNQGPKQAQKRRYWIPDQSLSWTRSGILDYRGRKGRMGCIRHSGLDPEPEHLKREKSGKLNGIES